MKKKMVYLIGIPGSGKTTLFRELLGGLAEGAEVVSQPFLHTVYRNGLYQLGGERETFGGTDVLPMNVQPKVVEWLGTTKATRIIAEGDRLANDKFFNAVIRQGWMLHVFLLNTPFDRAGERRDQRGSKQDPKWLAGRITKVRNLWGKWGAPGYAFSGFLSPKEIASAMRRAKPVIREFFDGEE